jgi:hypothetical protein
VIHREARARRVVRSVTCFASVLVVVLDTTGCARGLRQVQAVPGPPAGIGELWQEPPDIGQRDLFHGAGGSRLAPRDASYAFVARDTTGWSPGFDVRSRDGVQWSVKLGPEAQTEVVSSRILWAIGFHQPPTYYLGRWELTGQEAGPQPPGRFRPSLASQAVVGDWSWHENPFVGTREFGGLIVANLVLNSWDWKTSNNKIYHLAEPVNGVSRWFVVRDLGASLGRTTYPAMLKWFRLRGFGQGTRNDLSGFEQQGFIRRVRDDSRIEFDYRGIYRDVIDTVTVEHVRWACERLARLSDAQWHDAFRAGWYGPEQTSRFVAKIRTKIAQGLEVTAR